MSFKIIFEDKKSAVRYKEHMLSVLSTDKRTMTATEVLMDNCMYFGEWDDYRGWDLFQYPMIKQARIRETKGGYTLYLPDPVPFKDFDAHIPDHDELMEESLNMQDKAYADYFLKGLADAMVYIKDGRRKCMVWKKSKKKNVITEEWPCWFHCWTSNRILKEDGTVVDQLLAVCEFQDGHVERINFDHIRFVEVWE